MLIHALASPKRSLLIVVWLAAASCKEEESLGGVEADRELSSLDGDEWADVCAGAHRLSRSALEDDDIRRGRCLVFAETEATLGLDEEKRSSLCEASLQRCLREGPPELIGMCAVAPPATCDVTTQQLEDCLRAALEVYQPIGRDHSCATLTTAEIGDLLTEKVIRACQGLDDRCDGLFESGSDSVDSDDAAFDAGVLDAGRSEPIDLADWELRIRDHVEQSTPRAGCSEPEPSAWLDERAVLLAQDWFATPPEELTPVNAEWKLVSTTKLADVLDAVDRHLAEPLDSCTSVSYGLALFEEDGGTISVALILATCSECDGECKLTCE